MTTTEIELSPQTAQQLELLAKTMSKVATNQEKLVELFEENKRLLEDVATALLSRAT